MVTAKSQLVAPTIGVINSQVLDAAVKAVVTESIKTTLPTAAIKVCMILLLQSNIKFIQVDLVGQLNISQHCF